MIIPLNHQNKSSLELDAGAWANNKKRAEAGQEPVRTGFFPGSPLFMAERGKTRWFGRFGGGGGRAPDDPPLS